MNIGTNGLVIDKESNYYPFGIEHKGYNNIIGNKAYNYKYNGKELQENSMYDYGARLYMPDIGRWGAIGPLAEKTLDPYVYVWNNPIMLTDPDGKCPNCLTALGGALIAGGIELGGQLLAGNSLSEVDWADVGVETLKGGLIGSGVGAGTVAILEGSSIVAKSSFDYSKKQGNKNIFNGKKTIMEASLDGTLDLVAGGTIISKNIGKSAKTAVKSLVKAEEKAFKSYVKARNSFNKITDGGKNMYGSKAMLANKNLDKSASTLNNARINRIKAKTIQSAVKNGKVVNEGFQNWVIDKVKSFFGSEK